MAKDYSKLFDTKHLNADLKKRSLKSGAVTLTSQGMMFVIQLASTMILARILTPQDYGKLAMVVSITGLASILSNLGLSTATIQRAEITHEQVSTLFWINTAIGALVTVVIASLSPVVAWFYQTPELVWMMLALSSNFFINGMTVQHSALLNRQMKFYALAKIQVLSTLIGIASAIVAAKYGLGYWALVINSVVTSVASAIGAWLSSGWMPGIPRKSAEVKAMVKFGSDLVGFNVVNYFSRNLDNILIGRYHGSAELGFYSKAYQLLMMPITNLRDPMNKVAMPALSRLQDDPEEYRDYYKKYVSILSFVTMPLVVFLFIFSSTIIKIFLGDKWLLASDLFRILAIVSFMQPATSTRGLVLLTTSQSRKYLFVGFVSSIIVCASFVIGVNWGARGVAIAYAVETYIFMVPLLMYSFHKTPVNLFDFIDSVYAPILASLFMGSLCHLFYINANNYNDYCVILIGFIIALISYFTIFIIFFGGKKQLLYCLDYFKKIKEKKF
ncbi:lipopolysaccharide biosynthesis protein [Trichloromonas acetexigens]|uniref:Lipopolysaccharide biosynthesis protein n=1 Tax=Trichloromonas acetexigens TaxID=38815 RepID=A0A550JJH6_9BACT|nr:lipopolysaccharide biosynthesis protein [Desulfuromonas acetexigens]TRO83355.1 lipopolysaccharide biosynthesis protein [Desulfuromonas acetexigens]